MRRRVQWSRDALDDLGHQVRYIQRDNQIAAERVADRIRKAAAALGDIATGRKGRVSETYEKVVPGLPYIIAYRIASRPDGNDLITIVRVIHGARNWPPGEWPQ